MIKEVIPMDPIGLFRRAGEDFLGRLKQVKPEQWDGPSPNPGWTVRRLTNHLVSVVMMGPKIFRGQSIENLDEDDLLGPDPLAAAQKAFDDAVEAYSGPGVLDKKFPSQMMGERSGADYCLFFAADIAVHTWDLARALGEDHQIDAELVEIAWRNFEPMADLGRQMGAFGPKVEVPADAPKQDQLLGVTGRNPTNSSGP